MSSLGNFPTEGIDIKKAFEILAARASDSPSIAQEHKGCCGCGTGAPPSGVEKLGQIIDLTAFGSEQSFSGIAKTSFREQTACADPTDLRNFEIQNQLQKMSVDELVQYVLGTQQQRVLTYRDYDKGLDDLLESGDMTRYPIICASVTASFSVLSDAINAAGKVLQGKPLRRLDLVKCIRQLQALEKEKLSLTAALHLERVRERSQIIDVGDENDQILLLLRSSIRSLGNRIADLVDKINDVIDELRYALHNE